MWTLWEHLTTPSIYGLPNMGEESQLQDQLRGGRSGVDQPDGLAPESSSSTPHL